ncbi:PTS sugar transporter subunit IIA [Coralloluteibacterium thermophilus]|uniref:PTS sugar transporter subunit IIA n=1 Tax=Coralloluteibacterium thermophilum TaxID=2707049 RepID=A0ABV9NMM8_9GAMM
MPLARLLSAARIDCASAPDKSAALVRLAALLEPAVERRGRVLQALLARERIGSTALGHGVAVPHARLEDDGGRVCAAFLRLSTPIDFGAPDGAPVDLLLALSMPQHCSEHLQLLAEVSERLGDPALREALRAAPDTAAVLRLLRTRDAAAHG